MTIGIVGLGLTGGSFAKAYKNYGHTVFAADTDEEVFALARSGGVVDAALDERSAGKCGLIIIALCPEAACAWLRRMAEHISPGTMVIDACGTKRNVCGVCFELARRHGFTFIGGHPMAGTQFSGYRHSRATMFRGAVMILVPGESCDEVDINRAVNALAPAEFGHFTVTTAERHDAMISYTSQMAHVVSSAYVKNRKAMDNKGFSAGSFKDLTRVAWLNENMWTELFVENRDNLVADIDAFMTELKAYRDAIAGGDRDCLRALLAEGRLIKDELEPGIKRT